MESGYLIYIIENKKGGVSMKKKIIGALLLVLLIPLTIGCKSSMKDSAPGSPAPGGGGIDSGYSRDEEYNKPGEESGKTVSKKIIQTGEIWIIAEDIKIASKNIRSKADNLGGYIESEGITEYSGSAKVRIPSQRLEDFIVYLEKDFEVQSTNTSAQDITSVYIDNEARLNNYRAQEAQVLEIMKKANTVEEILNVQNELFRVRGEIEALEARKKAWDRDVDFSTINLYINKKYSSVERNIRILTGNEFVKSISKGFSGAVTGLVLFIQHFIIFIVSNIFGLIIFGGTGYFVYRKFIKK
jgi:hypothetical protein